MRYRPAIIKCVQQCIISMFCLFIFPFSATAQGRPNIEWMRGGHYNGTHMLDFFPDSQRLIAGGEECTFKIYDVHTGNLLKTIPTNGRVAFGSNLGKLSPDGSRLAALTYVNFGGPFLTVWDTTIWKPLWTRSAYGSTNPMWSSDGSVVGDSGSVYNAVTGAVDWNPGFNYSDLSRDGRTAISSQYIVSKSDPTHPTDISNASLANPVFGPTFTTWGLGPVAAFSSGFDPILGRVSWVQTSYGAFPYVTNDYGRFIWPQTAVSNRIVFGVMTAAGTDAWLQMYDTRTITTTNLAHFGPGPLNPNLLITGLAASADGLLAAFSRKCIGLVDESIRVATVPGGVQVGDFTSHSNAVSGVAYSAKPLDLGSGLSGHIAASVSFDQTVRLWNAATGAPLSTVVLPYGDGSRSNGVALTPDGRTMAAQCGNILSIYDITYPRAPTLAQMFGSSLYPPVFSPDGKFLAFAIQAGHDHTAVVVYQKSGSQWIGYNTGYLIASYSGTYTVCAFSPDSKTLAVGFDRNLRTYRLSDWTQLANVYTRPAEALGIAYSYDGKKILLSTTWGGVAAYDSTTLANLWADPYSEPPAYAIAADPSSDSFVTEIEPVDAFAPVKVYVRKLSTGALIKMYDVETGQSLDNAGSNPKFLSSFSYSPDGQFITYGRGDCTVVTIKNPAWVAPKLSSVNASPASLAGGATATGTVALTNLSPIGGNGVTLSSSNTALATVPASITVPVGTKSVTFPISTSGVTSTQTVTISATYVSLDNVSVTKTKVITLTTPVISSLTIAPTSVNGGTSATGTVKLTGAPAVGSGGIVVTLSSDSSAAGVLPTVTVPEGSISTTFAITTTGVVATTVATITAGYSGVSKTATLTVKPLVFTALTLSATSVIGGTTVQGTVSMSGPVAVDTAIPIISGNAKAHPPVSVTILEGNSSTAFDVTTDPVTANSTGAISATFGGVTKTAALTIKPPTYASFALSPNPVVGGNSVTGTVTMTGPVAANTTVTLTNSNTKATLPGPTVVIPAGSTSVTFTMSTVPTASNVSGAVKAQIGTVTKSVTLKVTP